MLNAHLISCYRTQPKNISRNRGDFTNQFNLMPTITTKKQDWRKHYLKAFLTNRGASSNWFRDHCKMGELYFNILGEKNCTHLSNSWGKSGSVSMLEKHNFPLSQQPPMIVSNWTCQVSPNLLNQLIFSLSLLQMSSA